jgi:hypothetical protein
VRAAAMKAISATPCAVVISRVPSLPQWLTLDASMWEIGMGPPVISERGRRGSTRQSRVAAASSGAQVPASARQAARLGVAGLVSSVDCSPQAGPVRFDVTIVDVS